MRVGAIDIGSNSIRLLVAELRAPGSQGELVAVARAGEPCRLGRGLDHTGEVDPEMAERAAAVTAEFAERARSLGAVRIVAAATAALRRAANGSRVAAAVAQRAGLPVRILTGPEEARLVYRAVILGLRAGARRSACVVFDLGGGSTEVVSGLGPEAGRWVSLPFGAVSLTERFIRSNPASQREVASLEDEVSRQVTQACADLPASAPLLAGVGGTVTLLASLDRGINAYDPTLIEGWMIKADRLGTLVRRVALSNEQERDSWPVLGKGRSDIVAAGALVVGMLARRFPSPGLVCSTQGLRYALARLAAEEATTGSDAPGGVTGADDHRGGG